MNQEKEEQLKLLALRIRKNQDITKGVLTYANCTHDVETLVYLILEEEKSESVNN
jgi:hypothetical protein